MKVFVAGAEGFIGRNVCSALESDGHEVYGSSRTARIGSVVVDLLEKDQLKRIFAEINPDVIINCAGIVGGNGNFADNVAISRNLIEAAATDGLDLHRFVVCGSAGEYGYVDPNDWPVSEATPLRATNPYALSKIEEERTVRELAMLHDIDFVIARIFNPLGSGMPARFLITNVLEQVKEIKAGKKDTISVGRADALRDYVYVNDVARALSTLAVQKHTHDVYNIGSGVATSTDELVRCIMDETDTKATIVETSSEPEDPVASQADISRLRDEFGWEPSIPLRQIVKEIVHDDTTAE